MDERSTIGAEEGRYGSPPKIDASRADGARSDGLGLEGAVARLGAAVSRQEEAEVLAQEAARLCAGPAAVALRRGERWTIAGAAATPVDLDGAVPPDRGPGEWLERRLGVPLERFELKHGRRLVGLLLTGGHAKHRGRELSALAAIGTPFLAAARPRLPVGAVELYVAQIVHDLKRPLSVLQLSMDLLGETALMESGHLARCRRSLLHLRELVADLATLADPASGRREPTALAPLLAELVDDHCEQARQRGIGLHLELAHPVTVTAARPALIRAFGNALANALELCPTASQVRVRLEHDARYAYVDVIDEGPGIPAELRERVFDPFFTTRKDGTGLGLTVVQVVARAHGGWARFLDERPTRLRIALARATPEARAARALDA